MLSRFFSAWEKNVVEMVLLWRAASGVNLEVYPNKRPHHHHHHHYVHITLIVTKLWFIPQDLIILLPYKCSCIPISPAAGGKFFPCCFEIAGYFFLLHFRIPGYFFFYFFRIPGYFFLLHFYDSRILFSFTFLGLQDTFFFYFFLGFQDTFFIYFF